MSLGTTKVCAESWAHSDAGGPIFVYTPTGVGDFYRWRMTSGATWGNGTDTSMYWIAGVCRGQCYPGHHDNADDNDTNFGTWTAGTSRTLSVKTGSGGASYLEYNVPANAIKVRALYISAASGDRVLKLQWWDAQGAGYGDDGQIGANVEIDTVDAVYGAQIHIGDWQDATTPVGAGAVAIRVVSGASASTLIGLDWITSDTPCDPDTADCVFDDSADVDVLAFGNEWTNYPNLITSTDIAVFWNTDGGGFSDTNDVGGISHHGYDTATIAWYTQDGTGALSAWTPTAGTRTDASDYFIGDCTAATVRLNQGSVTDMGDGVSRWVWGSPGIIMDHRITVNQDVDLYQHYTVQCRLPRDVQFVQFLGESKPKPLAYQTGVGNVLADTKTNGMTIWGGASHTAIRLSSPNIDTDLAYMAGVPSASYYPRVTQSDASDAWPKAYINRIYATGAVGTLEDVGNGETIGTRYEIGLKDQSLVINTTAPRRA